TKAIFPDLKIAVADLPAIGRVTGGATKTLARLYLAKAYLTYGWWLENPNNIPTYPETDRVDPDGHDAAWYFQEAYNVAVEALNDPGPFGLQETYYDVHVGTNDRNNEILLYADHTEESDFYNGACTNCFGNGDAPGNFAVWFMTWNYTEIRSAANPDGTGATSSVQREAVQPLGRPWIRMAPTIGAITTTFADKTLDSRYDGTFTRVYRGNWPKSAVTKEVLHTATNRPVARGHPIRACLGDGADAPKITNPDGSGASDVGAGEMRGRADYVVTPREIRRLKYAGQRELLT